jgi:hypothetical protein
MTDKQMQEPVANIPGLAADESAFIRWALKNKYDTSSHPMFFVMLDPKTHEALMGWKAAVAHYDLATPPAAKRQWVGLTDEERVDLWKATETDNRMVLIDAIEAKLKERNV